MDTFRHPVAAHVDAVLSDARFKASARLRRLMRYLAERTESGEPPPSQQEIATQVLGLAEDFDCVADSRVRVEVLRLRKALDSYNCGLTAGASRLTVPRGEYSLRFETLAAPRLHSAKADAGVPILIAVKHSRNQETDEQLEFCVNEALQLCATSPLVGPGRLDLHLVGMDAGGDPAEEARRIGAHAVLSLRARDDGTAFSLCATATAVPSGRVLAGVLAGAGGSACTAAEATTKAAREVAALIADPLTGIGRKLDISSRSRGGFGASLAAYDYIRTQRLGEAQQAWDRLVDVRSRFPADATTLALMADMCRVLAAAEQNTPPSYAQAVDLAEQAVLIDPDNTAARLSLGYGRLASGNVSGAARSAGQLGRARLFGSTQDDAGLLSVLAGRDAPSESIDGKQSPQTFIKLASEVIHHLDRDDYSAAAEALDAPHHDSIYWTQLFRVLVMHKLGETAAARRSVRQLNTLCPEFRISGKNIIQAFFGRRNLGLNMEASYSEVAMSDNTRSATSLGCSRV